MEPVDADRLGAAASECANTLDDKTVQQVERILDKWLPRVTLGYLLTTLTYARVQQTRYELAERRRVEQLRRQGSAIPYEILRATRSDEGAPITDDPGATVPVTEGLIQPTRAVDPFGRAPQGEARADSDGRESGDSNGGRSTGFPHG